MIRILLFYHILFYYFIILFVSVEYLIQIVRAHPAQNITNGYLLRDSKHSVKILKQANV